MSKIWDCCMFYNELDMLEARLNILNDVVDRFVICEAGETHSGKPKPAYFADNRARFAPFLDKIEYVYVPSLTAIAGENSWNREKAHRAAIAQGWKDVKWDDWLIVADVDEIPKPSCVDALHELWSAMFVKFELDFYYYDLNHKVKQGWSIGANQSRYGTDPNRIRNSANWTEHTGHPDFQRGFWNGGWHMSYFGGAEQVVSKVDAFMHADDPVIRDLPRDPAHIAAIMRRGADLYGRDLPIEHVPTSDTLPRYILDNAEQYRQMGWLE